MFQDVAIHSTEVPSALQLESNVTSAVKSVILQNNVAEIVLRAKVVVNLPNHHLETPT